MSQTPDRLTTQRNPRFADECAIGEVFGRAPVYDLIFSRISPRTLVRTGRSCRAAYAASKDFSHRAFNIHRHLSRFLTEPLAFRSLQARTGTLIAGSNVLQFLDRTYYPEADMDLYVHPGHVREVLVYLVEREGYTFKPNSTQHPDYRKIASDEWDGTEVRGEPLREEEELSLYYQIKGVESVFTLEKHGLGGPLKVQLIECEMSPFDTIVNFHSTCVMNFIAFDAVYSLYPVATFEHRDTLQVWRARPLQDLTVKLKYTDRGFSWRCTLAIGTPLHVSPFYPSTGRTVGDQYTWKLTLDTQGVDLRPQMNSSSLFQCDPVIFNGWSMEREDEGMLTVYKPIRSSVFRYNYTTANCKLYMRLWHLMLEQGLLSRLLLRTGLLEKDKWPWFDAELASISEEYKHDFTPFIRRTFSS